MRTLIRSTVGVAVLALGLVSPAWAATQFVVNMDSSQEVGTVVDPVGATGQGTLTLIDLGGGDFGWQYQITISPELDFSTVTGNAALANGGRPVTGFHIHNEARGVNGNVIYGLYGPDHDNDNDVTAVLNPDMSTTFAGSWDPTDGNPVGNINAHAINSLLPAISGQDVPFYFNAHTAPTNAGGEIRGQIVAVPEPTSCILLLTAALYAVLGAQRRACL